VKVKSANSTLAKNHDDPPLSPTGRLRLVQLHHFLGHDRFFDRIYQERQRGFVYDPITLNVNFRLFQDVSALWKKLLGAQVLAPDPLISYW
ncbi:hypothetical protein, partial [Pseudomonas sp. Leaf127]|uniref:hypothetical protein n=1 Tax=Pseudomonas sp. Leaf127 TaxID=1736267 RepID=UPI001F1F00F1